MAANRAPLTVSHQGPYILAGVGRALLAAKPCSLRVVSNAGSVTLKIGDTTYTDNHAQADVEAAIARGDVTLQAGSRVPGSIETSGGNAQLYEVLFDGVDVPLWDGTKRYAKNATFYADEIDRHKLLALGARGQVRVQP